MHADKEPDTTEGAAERTAQKELTTRVGTRLVPRSETAESKRGTRKWRFGMRRGMEK